MTKVYIDHGYVRPGSAQGTTDPDLHTGDPRMRPGYFLPVFTKCMNLLQGLSVYVEQDKKIQPPLFENDVETLNTALMLTTYLTSPNRQRKMNDPKQYNYLMEQIERMFPGGR